MNNTSWQMMLPFSAFATLAMISPSAVASTSDDNKKMLQLIKEQQAQIEKQAEQIRALSQRMESISTTPTSLPSHTRPERVGVDRKPTEQTKPPKVAAVQDDGGVLLSPGKMVLEPTFEYSRSSALRAAIEGFTIIPALNIGSFEISEVDRDTLIGSLNGRIGVVKDLELEMRVPYVYRSDNSLSRPIGTGSSSNVLSSVQGDGLGDIEVGARYQLTHGKDGWPFLISGLRFKSRTGTDPFEVPIDPTTGLEMELPTGSGFYALQPTITAILPSDPVVLYGSMGYLYNMSRDVGGRIGKIDPGDSVSLSFGMGFSVNEKTSFSLGYSHSYVFETQQNGAMVANSDELHVGAFSTGFAYSVNDSTSLNLNVEAGLTEDAPDVRLIFRVPMAVDFF
jgi:hypothetical protein